MSVLFIGPYRQLDEWGRRSFNILQSLKKIDLDITARPLFLTSNDIQTEVEETEYTRFDEYDILIQHALPTYFISDKSFKKNIGVIDLETIDIAHSGWLSKFNLVDEIWINSNVVKKYLETQFPQKTIRNIQNFLDTSMIENFPHEGTFEGIDPNRFKFYFMGDASAKNGIEERKSYGFRDPVVRRVCDKFVKRSDIGYEKYGDTFDDERRLKMKGLT